MVEDVLGLLLPEASSEERAALRRVVTALRLLRDDARAGAPRRVEPSWWSARRELERLERRQRWRALEALVHAYLSALRPADSFLDLGQPLLDCAGAWRTLLSQSTSHTGFPPSPLETPLAVVERLLEAGVASGATQSWRILWTACARHVAVSAADAEQHWDAALRASPTDAHPLTVARLVAGLAAARLDRFQPARAYELLAPHVALIELDPALRRLLGWSALLCGRLAAAQALLGHPADPAAWIPRSLAELRGDEPGWADLLRGNDATSSLALEEKRSTERHEFGALLLGVFEGKPDGRARILALDTAPGLHGEATRRFASNAGSGPASALGPLEWQKVQRLRAVASTPLELPIVLARGRTRALALTGLRDAAGRSRGWVQLESTHQLLPSAARLTALARAWSRTLEVAPERVTLVGSPAVTPCRHPFDALDPRNAFALRLFDGLEPRARLRTAWIEHDERGLDCIRAQRGMASETRWMSSEAAQALADARARPGIVRYERRGSSGARGGATVGAALSLSDSAGKRVLGLLVLESERESLLSEAFLVSARAVLVALEPLWWATAFRANARARTGDDLAWDPERRFLSALEPAAGAAAASRAPLLLLGAPGSGRRTLARWLHFRGPAPGQALVEGLGAAVAGTRLVELELLDQAAQLALARTLAAGGPERLLLLGQAPNHVLRERGLLSGELERRMDPLPLAVPPLRERRDEIPALVGVLADNVARRACIEPAHFGDAALSDLWRQEWRGGVAELASLVSQLAHARAGQVVGPAEVRAAFRARRLDFRERLPSQRPRALDLELALQSTRHRLGSENRARAARYLGWDPETLEARLRDFGPSGRARSGGRKKHDDGAGSARARGSRH